MNIGESIKRLRVSKKPKVTQKKMAESIGISQTHLCHIEYGKKNASTEVLEGISQYFGIPLAIMFWMGVEEKDIKPEKLEFFKTLKPTIDSMIKQLF